MSKYRSIVTSLADRIRSGELLPGSRLPPQRQLAAQLGVDLTTVTRAYTELKRMGLVEGRTGSGSFVHGVPAAAAPAADGFDLSMNVPPRPAGLGDRVTQGLAAVLAGPEGGASLGYQPSGGTARDRAAAAGWLGRRLGPVEEDRVVVAAGAQSALFAVLDLLLDRGDTLACAGLTYPGVRAIAAHLGLRMAGLAHDGEGLDPGAFAELCRTSPPKALYIVPTIASPTTATLPPERREAVAAIARRHGVAIVEDDAYGALPETAPPPLAALAPETVWHVASLSKCATPALRVAYVAAPDARAALPLTAGLRAISLMASPLTAALATRWIGDGTLDALTAAIRAENRARQRLAASLLPAGAVAAHPDGNHLWLALPEGWTAAAFTAAARESGLLVVPADAFDVAGSPPRAVRLSLGGVPDRTGLERALLRLSGLLTWTGGAGGAIV
ncbi:PLP-dependent aminotransferase family protein [Inquilinus sp. Marseille-Q2685]|uniref:aminotransferase-like domain-containing protein n=1 Tax=Inquilinus sp. Marseille-Q2685 TaxID=2866581 RepID=UPI001CE40106|nr:PLP-dependent aminotransferase family protein [Inquilinus sp. Marseille-Q2685]